MSWYYRAMRTTQERKNNQYVLYAELQQEYPLKRPFRTKRAANRLVNAWDDVPRGWRDRSWKRYRKHQFKVKSNKPKRSSKKYAEHMARRNHDHCDWRWRYRWWL